MPMRPSRFNDTVPLVTVSVTWTWLVPASTSCTERPLPVADDKTRGVLRSVVWAPGTELTGGSFVDAIERVVVAGSLLVTASLATNMMLRDGPVGFSDVLLYTTVRTTCSSSAIVPNDQSVSTPVPLL